MLSIFLIIEQICIIVLESLLLLWVLLCFLNMQSSFAQYSEMLDSFHTLKIKS